MRFFRIFVIGIGLLVVWQGVVVSTGAPPYILPDPVSVVRAALAHSDSLLDLMSRKQSVIIKIQSGKNCLWPKQDLKSGNWKNLKKREI